jgi:3-isopropylmalate dehydrogenase
MVKKKYKIAVLPGDGTGKEVIPEAVKVLKAAQEVVGLNFDFIEIPCGGEYYLKTGKEWPDEAWQICKEEADAILFGAIGWEKPLGKPVRLPDGKLAGLNVLFGLRFGLDLYANVRPVKLYPGVFTPLANKNPKDIDMVFIRENTEDLYAPIGGILARGGIEELASDVRMITRKGSERVINFAFKYCLNRKRGAPVDGRLKVTCVDKSNVLRGCQFFRKIFDEVAEKYPEVAKDYAYVDAMAMWMVRNPENYDVVVCPNMFGDILTDLGAAIQGGMGMAPGGNIGDKHAMFEPIHGSAPRHAGKQVANPIAAILAAQMMLSWLADRFTDEACAKAARIIEKAVAEVLKDGRIRTYDLCVGPYANVRPSSSSDVGDAIAHKVKEIKSLEDLEV